MLVAPQGSAQKSDTLSSIDEQTRQALTGE